MFLELWISFTIGSKNLKRSVRVAARAGPLGGRDGRRGWRVWATRFSDVDEASLLLELPPGELSEVDLDLGRM